MNQVTLLFLLRRITLFASCITAVIMIVRICKFVLILVCLELLLLLGICGCDVIDIEISIQNA